MSTDAKQPTLLIVEDEDLQYEVYEETFGDLYRLVRARSGSEMLVRVTEFLPDLVILDHVLEDGEQGLAFLSELAEIAPYAPIIVVSGALEAHERIEALQGPRRATYCLTKPVDLAQLADTVSVALRECGPTEIVRRFTALERSRRVDAEDLLSRSTDRLSRQNRLRSMLKDVREKPNISHLARDFGVARRTILRDLGELIRRGEIPQETLPEYSPK